jgi:hypothetical protein
MLARVPDRYPISTLDSDEHDVLLTVGDVEMVGRLRLTATGKARFQIRKTRTSMEDLPREALVALWRPMDVSTWPYELPEAASITREQRSNRTESVRSGDLPAGVGADSHIYLGRPGEAPASQEETELRLIRCIRTRNVLERESYATQSLWPRPWLDEALIKHKQFALSPSGKMAGWREDDYEDFFVDRSELNARPARFAPTHRDVSDYEANIDKAWLNLIAAYDRWIFHARAKLPPLDWWQIADEERVDEHVIVERYGKALEKFSRGWEDESHPPSDSNADCSRGSASSLSEKRKSCRGHGSGR